MTVKIELASPAIDEASPGYRGWRAVLACFVMAVLCWGFGFYGHGFYLAELQHRNGWPASLIASASTLYYLFSALLVVFINDTIRRFGARACVLVGAVALAGSATALPFITAPWQLFAAYLVMAFAWATMSLGAINNILGLWFERKRGLAISLALNGASFGGVIIVPGLVFLTGAAGFTVAMLAGAAFILVLMVPIAVRILDGTAPPHPLGPSRESSTAGPPAPPTPWTRRRALGSLAFWSASAPFALAITSQAGFLVHQIAFLEPAIGRYAAGIAVAITTSMAIVGRLTLGAFADAMNQRLAAALSLIAQAAALALMTQTHDATTLFAACAVYGFSVGNVITFPSLIIQREFDAAAFGMLIGLSTGLGQFTYAFGPGLLGLVRDATGGYGAALGLCIALNLAAAAIVVRRPRVHA
jgi:MFS family permease